MRKLFVLLIAASMLFTAGCAATSGNVNLEDIPAEYVFPGEWEKHEGTWLI